MTKNHDLRELVVRSIEAVLDHAIKSVGSESDGGKLLRTYRRNVRDHLVDAAVDPRFDPARYYLPADALLGFKEIPEDKAFKIGTRSDG